MTYLNIINAVLRRMRETEVTSISETAYVLLLGELVNEAKRTVESAWDWSALRADIDFNATAGTVSYSLTGSGDRPTVLDVINTTSKKRMCYETTAQFRNFTKLNDAQTGSPFYFTYNGIDANGDTKVDVYPTPDATYALSFTVVKRPADLSTSTDTLLVPSAPVIQIATALAARERGETGGTSAAEHFALADRTLSDAIAFDAAKYPEELVWRVL